MMVVKCKQASRQHISVSVKLGNRVERFQTRQTRLRQACITYTSKMNKYKALAILLAMPK
jgi:hypothetical protein